MKRQFLVILVLSALSPTVFGQFIGDSYKDSKTKGKIDSVIETRYQFNDNDTTGRRFFDRLVYIFNVKGQIVKCTEHSMDSYFTLITVYSYDNKGYIQKKRVDEKDKNVDTLSAFSMTTYTYAPDYRSVKVDYIRTSKIKPDFLTDFTDFIDLDQSGKMLKDSSFYFGTSQITGRHSYHYNAKGYLVELDAADGNIGGMPAKTFFTYDNNDNIIKEELTFYHGTYNHITTPLNTYIRTYSYPKLDNKHNWLIKNNYYEDKLERITERRIYYSK
ncbi:hypothetical protein [Mucilaginibacter sp. UYCu711]|uniref:hypothetical protein n=1 Tax=Mucilaginibacter sp. UYCu711 TaxID=3156339 RepID=UPI003D259370